MRLEARARAVRASSGRTPPVISEGLEHGTALILGQDTWKRRVLTELRGLGSSGREHLHDRLGPTVEHATPPLQPRRDRSAFVDPIETIEILAGARPHSGGEPPGPRRPPPAWAQRTEPLPASAALPTAALG